MTLTALSACFGTILSGHLLACVTDFVYVVLGGVLFVVGLIAAIIGVVMPVPAPTTPYPPGNPELAPAGADESDSLQEVRARLQFRQFLLPVLRPETKLTCGSE